MVSATQRKLDAAIVVVVGVVVAAAKVSMWVYPCPKNQLLALEFFSVQRFDKVNWWKSHHF